MDKQVRFQVYAQANGCPVAPLIPMGLTYPSSAQAHAKAHTLSMTDYHNIYSVRVCPNTVR